MVGADGPFLLDFFLRGFALVESGPAGFSGLPVAHLRVGGGALGWANKPCVALLVSFLGGFLHSPRPAYYLFRPVLPLWSVAIRFAN